MQVCSIRKRTAYRYIGFISEAGIPIHFDREVGGYCLMSRKSSLTDDLTLGESLLLVTCLQVSLYHVNADYGQDVKRLIDKIVARSPFPLENTVASLNEHLLPQVRAVDHSATITSALVQAAVHLDRSLVLTIRENELEPATVRVDDPGLLFDKDWKVHQRLRSPSNFEALTQVTRVTVL